MRKGLLTTERVPSQVSSGGVQVSWDPGSLEESKSWDFMLYRHADVRSESDVI